MGKSNNTTNNSPFKKLGDVCTYSKGKKPVVLKETKTKDCSVPYVNIKAFEKGIITEYTDGVKCNICNDDDLLMVWDGARCGLIGKAKKGAVGSTLMKILPKENIHKEYLYHFISSKFWTLNTKPKGVGIPHIEPTLLWNFELVVPPLPEQQAIVAKIEELLSELENGKQQLLTSQQQLKVYRQSLLKWAFEGKEQTTVGALFDFVGGGTPSKKIPEYWQGDIPWASVKDVKGDYLKNTQDRISLAGLKDSASNLAKPKDVILITRISPGKTIITNIETAINQDLKIVKPKFETTPKFIFYVFKSIEWECVKKSSGTTVLGINLTSLKEISVPKLNLKEQQIIVDELESKLTVCDKIEETISQSLLQAETLKQSILKKAFEGKFV